MALYPDLVPVRAARVPQRTRCWNSPTPAITACACRSSRDYNQALPNQPGQTLGHPAAPAQPELRRHHLGGSRRGHQLQRLLGALRASLLRGPVLPELVHLVQGAGRPPSRRWNTPAATTRPIRRTSTTWQRSAAPPASTSSSSTPPASSMNCRSAKAASSAPQWNGVFDAVAGRLGPQHHQLRQHRNSARCQLHAGGGQRRHRPHPRLSRRGHHAAQRQRRHHRIERPRTAG